jgi:hypothetical protein
LNEIMQDKCFMMAPGMWNTFSIQQKQQWEQIKKQNEENIPCLQMRLLILPAWQDRPQRSSWLSLCTSFFTYLFYFLGGLEAPALTPLDFGHTDRSDGLVERGKRTVRVGPGEQTSWESAIWYDQ